VVHRLISTCDVTEELKAGGTDDVCEYMMGHSRRSMPTTGKCSTSIAESFAQTD